MFKQTTTNLILPAPSVGTFGGRISWHHDVLAKRHGQRSGEVILLTAERVGHGAAQAQQIASKKVAWLAKQVVAGLYKGKG